MEHWQKAWHKGIAPQIPLATLKTLKAALETNDPFVITGVNCTQMTAHVTGMKPSTKLTGCCPLAFCGWVDHNLTDPVEISKFMTKVAHEADNLTNGFGVTGDFISWVDKGPREEVLSKLLIEVIVSIEERERDTATRN